METSHTSCNSRAAGYNNLNGFCCQYTIQIRFIYFSSKALEKIELELGFLVCEFMFGLGFILAVIAKRRIFLAFDLVLAAICSSQSNLSINNK